MADQFDVIVVGSGPAGGTCARDCARGDLSVAVVEEREFGGVCPNRGCNPKKVLLDSAEAVRRIADLQGKGIRGDAQISWPELMSFKRSFTQPVSDRVEQALGRYGIKNFRGCARFVDHETITVGDDILKGRHILLAPGSYPLPLDIPSEDLLVHSDEFLELDDLPERIVFLGGGFISFEFAHMSAAAGSRAIILNRSDRPLKQFDQDLVNILLKASADLGVEVRLDIPVRSIRRNGSTLLVDTDAQIIEADMVVHGASRIPDIRGLDVEAGGVSVTRNGAIEIDEHLRNPGNPRVFAAGDAAASPCALTPSANMEGRVAARNILHGNIETADYTGIPSTVFSIPPLGCVGVTEEQARREGIPHSVRFRDTSGFFSSRKIGQRFSAYKIVFSENRERILGAHILGHNAEEAINIFALAIRCDLSVKQLEDAIWVYPSYIYDIGYMLG